jgi:hypothetical protein
MLGQVLVNTVICSGKAEDISYTNNTNSLLFSLLNRGKFSWQEVVLTTTLVNLYGKEYCSHAENQFNILLLLPH